ncbi:MAG TPA: tyrosine-type recombinase/integrase [Actinomycetota bacterium]|nr:tyrosine-type recombinase/integrase [Actinomycetota bacterium]
MGSIREREGRKQKYEARYLDPAGKLRSKSFARKSDAKAFLAAIETDKRRGNFVDPAHGRIPFERWALECFEGRLHLRASTRARDESQLRTHILPAFASHPIGAITKLGVQSFVRSLSEKGLAPRTVRECYHILGGILAQAADAKLIGDSPCHRISLPRIERHEQRYLTPDEIERLAAAIWEPFGALVYSSAYLGCRWGELVGLKRENLDLLRRKALIVGTLEEVGGRLAYIEETKTDAGRRTLSIPASLVEILAEHLARAPQSEYVFPGANGGPLRRSNFRKRHWRLAVERAGLAPLRFHDLRHTCAALLIAQGAHVKEIQMRLGHASVTTTLDVYGHLFPSMDAALTDRLDSVLRDAKAGADLGQIWANGPAPVLSMEEKETEKTA